MAQPRESEISREVLSGEQTEGAARISLSGNNMGDFRTALAAMRSKLVGAGFPNPNIRCDEARSVQLAEAKPPSQSSPDRVWVHVPAGNDAEVKGKGCGPVTVQPDPDGNGGTLVGVNSPPPGSDCKVIPISR